jgi:hypothetical protein
MRVPATTAGTQMAMTAGKRSMMEPKRRHTPAVVSVKDATRLAEEILTEANVIRKAEPELFELASAIHGHMAWMGDTSYGEGDTSYGEVVAGQDDPDEDILTTYNKWLDDATAAYLNHAGKARNPAVYAAEMFANPDIWSQVPELTRDKFALMTAFRNWLHDYARGPEVQAATPRTSPAKAWPKED